MEEKAVIIFYIKKRNFKTDLEVPLNITANDLVLALNKAYDLGIDTSNVLNCYLKAENPIALLRGNRTLGGYGLRNGSILNFTD